MLTKLEAVNLILRAVQESPVSSLDSGLPDAEQAEAVLDEVSKEVQKQGWHCNTDYEMELAPNVDGKIVIADTFLKVDANGRDAWRNVTVRRDVSDAKLYLYDIDEQTMVFTRSVYCDVVHLFEFEDLTASLQNYIAHHTARRFQQQRIGSLVLDKNLAVNETVAWAALADEEAENEDTNPLRTNPGMAWAFRRNNPLAGR